MRIKFEMTEREYNALKDAMEILYDMVDKPFMSDNVNECAETIDHILANSKVLNEVKNND